MSSFPVCSMGPSVKFIYFIFFGSHMTGSWFNVKTYCNFAVSALCYEGNTSQQLTPNYICPLQHKNLPTTFFCCSNRVLGLFYTDAVQGLLMSSGVGEQ